MKEQGSFVLYHDMESSIRELTDEEAGKLLKAIFRYHKTGDPGESDRVVRMAFIPIKTTLDRDREKYAKICERNSRNGSRWWRPKDSENIPKEPTGFSGIPGDPKKADSDSDSDSDTKVDTSLRSVSTAPVALNLSQEKLERKEAVDAIIDALKDACEESGVMYAPGNRERIHAWNILRGKQFGENAAKVSMDRTTFAQNIIRFASKLTYCPATYNAETVYANYARVYQAGIKEKEKLVSSKEKKRCTRIA